MRTYRERVATIVKCRVKVLFVTVLEGNQPKGHGGEGCPG